MNVKQKEKNVTRWNLTEEEARKKYAKNLCVRDKKLLLVPFGHLNRLWKTENLVNRSELCLLCKENSKLWRNLFFINICNCFHICVNDQVLWRWIIGHLATVDCFYSVSHVWGQRILGKECHRKRKGGVLFCKEIAQDQSGEIKRPMRW